MRNGKCLIVSLGSIGRRHLANIRLLMPEIEIGLLRLQAEHKNADVPSEADKQFSTIEAAVTFQPDFAIIACPATFHLAVALPLVKAGISVLIEKPIAEKCAGIERLIDEASCTGAVLMVGYNFRFMPSLQAARQIVQSGGIGRVLGARAEVGQYLPMWRKDSDYETTVTAQKKLGGGALLELSHEIDYLYWIFGMPSRVSANGGKYSDLNIDVEDMVALSLEYDDPPRLIQVHLDLLQHAVTRTCKFIGTDGILIWDGIKDEITLFDRSKGDWKVLCLPKVEDKNEMYLEELRHFISCLETKAPPLVDAYQGVDVLRIVEFAKKSMVMGQVVFAGGNDAHV